MEAEVLVAKVVWALVTVMWTNAQMTVAPVTVSYTLVVAVVLAQEVALATAA